MHGRIVADLPTGRASTVYSRTGDVVAQAMVAAWLGLLALLAWRRKRVSAAPSSPSPR